MQHSQEKKKKNMSQLLPPASDTLCSQEVAISSSYLHPPLQPKPRFQHTPWPSCSTQPQPIRVALQTLTVTSHRNSSPLPSGEGGYGCALPSHRPLPAQGAAPLLHSLPSRTPAPTGVLEECLVS